jgi:hypothetical protein
MKIRCGQNEIIKILKNVNKNEKSIPPTSIIEKNLPKNCYCSSITGKYAFDLSIIVNFKIYFWQQDDNVNLNTTIKDVLKEQNTIAIDWPSVYKTQTRSALGLFTSFINKTSLIVSNYEECDIVCVLGETFTFLGACYGPEYLKNNSVKANEKVVLFLDNSVTTENNIKKGGKQYLTLIHEFGHAFGLAHPHDDGAGSTIIPGINYLNNGKAIERDYKSFSGYGQNSVFNTVMSYMDISFFLPEVPSFENELIGYPQTLMPLDLLALRWLYDIVGTSSSYIQNYGFSNINPSTTLNKSQMIVGSKLKLTFGSNCKNISFYFSNQLISVNNIEPIIYEYNRILEKNWGFYPKDVASTISELNFNNKNISNVFIDKEGIKVNLRINLLLNKVFNMYIRDVSTNYTLSNNIYKNKITNLTITINNVSKASVTVFFS